MRRLEATAMQNASTLFSISTDCVASRNSDVINKHFHATAINFCSVSVSKALLFAMNRIDCAAAAAAELRARRPSAVALTHTSATRLTRLFLLPAFPVLMGINAICQLQRWVAALLDNR